MLSIAMLIRQLLEKLGLWKDSESPIVKIPKLRADIKQYEKERAASEDKLKDFEREISELEAGIKAAIQDILVLPEGSKSRTLKEKAVARQNKLLENTFSLNDMIFSTLDTYDMVIVKTRALILAIENGAPDIETLTFDLKDKIGELKDQQREIERLENTRYESPASATQIDLSAIMSNVGMATSAETPKTSEPAAAQTEAPQPAMPRYEEPPKPVMPTSEEVANLEAQLLGANENKPEPKTETTEKSEPEQLKE